MTTPIIHTWKGRAVSEMSREELENEFIQARLEINELLELNLKYSTENIKLMAELARRA